MRTHDDVETGDSSRPPDHPRVIIAGNLTIDDVVLPDGTTHMASTGGNSLYAALGARLWQPAIGIVTRRGEDFPRDLHAELQHLGIATDGIVAISGPTVRNWVVYEIDGTRHWIYRTPRARSREVALQPEDIPASWLTSSTGTSTARVPVVHIAAMPIEAAEALVNTVRRIAPQAILTLDTHEDYVRDYRERLRALASRVDAFIPSRDELADLVGFDDPVRALEDLAELPTPFVVIKLGPDGVLVWDRAHAELTRVEAVPGEVVDVTGAGDAFCGGFASGLLDGRPAAESAQRGVISAFFAISGFSSLRLAQVTPEMAELRLSREPPVVHHLAQRSIAAGANVLPTGSTVVPPPTSPEIPGADRGISGAATIMREEIEMVPRLITLQSDALATTLHMLAADLTQCGIEHLYMVGCGDSAFAGEATALAFQKHTGIDAVGVHALEFARYRVRYLPRQSAVMCISFSGKVGRTIEAAAQAQRFGHYVIALTGNADSPLAERASSVVKLDVPTLGYSPGTSTYLALLAALYDLMFAWGKTRGLDLRSAREVFDHIPEHLSATLQVADTLSRDLAPRLATQPWITFLGAGPNLATARFGAAKLFEGPQMLGTATNLEEWAHEEYFISGRGTPVILIAPTGASFSRAQEILAELTYIGADTVLVSDAAPRHISAAHLPIAVGVPEEFTPLLAALPLSLLAYDITCARHQDHFEFASPEAAREHYDTIHRATMGEPA